MKHNSLLLLDSFVRICNLCTMHATGIIFNFVHDVSRQITQSNFF